MNRQLKKFIHRTTSIRTTTNPIHILENKVINCKFLNRQDLHVLFNPNNSLTKCIENPKENTGQDKKPEAYRLTRGSFPKTHIAQTENRKNIVTSQQQTRFK